MVVTVPTHPVIAVGKATGSAKLKREGDIQEAKGDAQTAMGKAGLGW
jgi:hypothetical protein